MNVIIIAIKLHYPRRFQCAAFHCVAFQCVAFANLWLWSPWLQETSDGRPNRKHIWLKVNSVFCMCISIWFQLLHSSYSKTYTFAVMPVGVCVYVNPRVDKSRILFQIYISTLDLWFLIWWLEEDDDLFDILGAKDVSVKGLQAYDIEVGSVGQGKYCKSFYPFKVLAKGEPKFVSIGNTSVILANPSVLNYESWR